MNREKKYSIKKTDKETLEKWFRLMTLGRILDDRAPNYLKQAIGWSYHAPFAGHDGIQLAIGQVFDNGGKLVAIAIAISIFGTISIYTMSAPRIYFAMANDGLFFPKLAEVHPRFKTPHWAMLFQAGWASILIIFWETFNDLITYVTVVDIAFMTLGGISLFVFRKKMPAVKRPYRVVAYPVIPLVFILISAAFVVNTLFTETKQAMMGFGVLLVGIPVYYFFKKKTGRVVE